MSSDGGASSSRVTAELDHAPQPERRNPMPEIRPRETVILASDFDRLVTWYVDVLGFRVTRRFDDGFHYCNLETNTGIAIGIGVASEMGVSPGDRLGNTVILQFEVDDVRSFLESIAAAGGSIRGEAAFNEKDRFWFGMFTDPEGHPFWVVDSNCP
ncbi:MAG: VOC family protein [Planctomycetes bacterium]|nr:VOC family protein [Planctomycetota bacterium]